MSRDQRSFDDELRRAFAPPADVDDIARRAVEHARAELAAEHAPAGVRRVAWRPLAAAAALLLALGALLVASLPDDDGEPLHTEIAWERIYAELTPETCSALSPCVSTAGIVDHVRAKHGAGLVVELRDQQPLYGPFTSEHWPEATALAAPEGDGHCVVLVEALADDPRPAQACGDGLRRHRREVGDLVLYELSPNDEPRCLDWFTAGGD